MSVKHYVETMLFENNILSLRGWIFDESSTVTNDIQSVKLIICSKSGKKIESELFLIEREDVAQAFGLKNKHVGFEFLGSVGRFVQAILFLEVEANETSNRIELGTIEGNETEQDNEKLEIEYPSLDGYYNLKNFDKVGKQYGASWEKANKVVDVIIPVYNGYQYLETLFKSLYKTDISMRIIVINDCSPDVRVEDFFADLCRIKDNIIYIKNDINLGFVKSVNKGLRLVEHDVALVNTDVEVPNKWLERLMYPIFNDEKVASTTPYTNCGTLCSFPNMGQDNTIYDDRSVFFVDSIFGNIVPQYTPMPTGVGFCMGMSYKAIQSVGLLDEENFSKGYGEENDWCQRAIEKGYKNVHVENLYVYHKHGGSFQSLEKAMLLEENTKRLLKKHPDYLKDVALYFEHDCNKKIREYAYFMCLMQSDVQTNLYFNHILGGGANDYLLAQKKEALAKGIKCITIFYNVYKNCYHMEIAYKDYEVKLYSDTLKELLIKAQLSSISKIYINELVTYPDLYDVLEEITALKNKNCADVIMLGHDYFCVCPTINLLSNEGRYCGVECLKSDKDCLENNQYICDSRYTSIKEWNRHWGNFLNECTEIIVFSEDSKKIFKKFYPYLNNIVVIPHVTNKMLEIKKVEKVNNSLNIGILGVLSERKGLSIVKQMLKIIEEKKLDINIVIVGSCEEEISSEHCIITGKYSREELPRLMYLYDIDLIFIASVWPETFSYTAEEAMKMHMPLAVFDLGAPAERVKKYDKGIIINNISAEDALEKIQNYTNGVVMEKKSKYTKVLFVIEYESFSSRYRVEHLREHLAIRGIDSCVVDLKDISIKDIKYYNLISIYRCSDVKSVSRVAREAEKNKIPLLYDIDDFIFEYKQIESLDFLNDEEYEGYEGYSNDIKECMAFCDVITTSTTNLARQIEKSFPSKRVIECRNVACLEMQLLSEIAVENKEEKEEVILGYFSGSKTHNNDWKLIEKAIVNIMNNNDMVKLVLCGVLEISDELEVFSKRITKIPFVSWRKLPELIRGIDINLMPLEDNLFQWCKSENKWMEAGLVGVPTIASSNPELQGVVKDGENVLLCSSENEWQQKLQSLIEDKQLRERIGAAAKEEVYRTHLVTSDKNFEQLVEEINKAI